MKIIPGKKIADKILTDLKKEIARKKIKPALAVVLVGKDPASHLYVRLKQKAARKAGIGLKKYLLPVSSPEKDVLRIIKTLNQDKQIHGILVQLPLPDKFSARKIINAINPQKDIDGLRANSKFTPPFISAVWQALAATKENLKNKKTLALVNSHIFGRRLTVLLKQKGLKTSYQLNSRQIKKIRQAEILITALGAPNTVKKSMIKPGAILIDGGISKQAGRIKGDIDAAGVKNKARYLSPVPGGLGPLTVCFLLKNACQAAGVKPNTTSCKDCT